MIYHFVLRPSKETLQSVTNRVTNYILQGFRVFEGRMYSCSCFVYLVVSSFIVTSVSGAHSSSVIDSMLVLKDESEEPLKLDKKEGILNNMDNLLQPFQLDVNGASSEDQMDVARPPFTGIDLNLNADSHEDFKAYDVMVATGAGNQTGGAVYTRWGRSDCRYGSELVYTGTAVGSYYLSTSYTGSGSNYLCLPRQPVYDEVYSSSSSVSAYLYSSQYMTSSAPYRLRSVNYHTPTCAVCLAPSGFNNQLMVPGRNQCPSDEWRLEYKGYLMAERYSHVRSKFICMDREMQAEPGTQGNQGGAYFYMVEGRCISGGGLHCGPYINGYELTCAVCTI